MKKLILFIFFSVSSILNSQVKKIFYVEDVRTIDYVTVKFCVNDSARISKVTVLPNKTTYRNKETIVRLVDYLKTVQYYPDSKLKNNCYESTFEFVNKKYQNSEIEQAEMSKCKKFKIGRFKYLDVRYIDTKIVRRRRSQREKNKNFKAKYEITWKSSCDYEMKYLKVKGKENQYMIGKVIKVKIIGVLNDSYIFKADFLERPTVIGEMRKIN